ncbi:hypothetical protein [Streptomyces sp. NPDC050287]
MPHLLTSILTKAAVALIEAMVARLLAQLWTTYVRNQGLVAG